MVVLPDHLQGGFVITEAIRRHKVDATRLMNEDVFSNLWRPTSTKVGNALGFPLVQVDCKPSTPHDFNDLLTSALNHVQ